MANEKTAENKPAEQPTVQNVNVFIPFPESFVYANCVAFATSQNEIRLSFAEAMQDGKAVPKVGIVMPPETAAVLALVLFQQVQVFESTFGEIRHPMWRAMKAGQDPTPFAPKSSRSVAEEPKGSE